MEKVLITGATGLIGKALVDKFVAANIPVVITSRNREKAETIFGSKVEVLIWDSNSIIRQTDLLKSITAVIHLAGAGVADKRWTTVYKELIYSSRIDSTRYLFQSFKQANCRPNVFVGSSATGIYGSRGDEILTELSSRGEGFLSDVCFDWEKEVNEFTTIGARTVSIRTGIVLSTENGAFPKLSLPFQFFLRVTLGSGNQWFSWIHIDDIVEIYYQAVGTRMSGVYNGVAPEPVTMEEFTKTLSKLKKTFFHIKVPEFLLNVILGESAFEVLKSQRVISSRLQNENFTFKHPTLLSALKNLLPPNQTIIQ